MRRPGYRAPSDSELRYVSTYANPVSRFAPYRRQVMHLAGSGNFTFCGRKLADPWTVYRDSGHRLCAQCASVRANQ